MSKLVQWMLIGCFAAGICLPAAENTPEGGHTELSGKLTPVSVIDLTYEHNLLIAASRYEMEAAQLEFDRFERNLSQFIPLIVRNEAEHTSDNFRDPVERNTVGESRVGTSIGMEKEFFDGKKVSVGVGARAFSEDGTEYGNPFIETELEMPLFSSFTRLERITERNFEESQMLETWLKFIETIQERAQDSQERYFSLQQAKNRYDIAAEAVEDLRVLLNEPSLKDRYNERVQIEDLMQFFQSESVGFKGEMEALLIELMDVTGLAHLEYEDVHFLDFESESFYGGRYLSTSLVELIEDAMANDVRMRILEIALGNAELKKRLSIQGKWEIIGKLFGRYDFQNRGDDPREERGYFVGVGFDVQRNDPHLLSLSRRQAEAEMRRFEAEIAYRRRQLYNLIRRLVIEATSLRKFVDEVTASRISREGVFEQKLEAYLKGEETVDNLLTSREALYHIEGDVVEAIKDFYDIIVDLDSASGLYFEELAQELETLELSGEMTMENGSTGAGMPGNTP